MAPSKKIVRELEHLHILRTIANYDEGAGMHAASIADRANAECDHDAFDDLPAISRRGIGAKLNGLQVAGYVSSKFQAEDGLHLWSLTEAGRRLAASDPRAVCGVRTVTADPAGLAAARRSAEWCLGDPGWADKIVNAYLSPRATHRYLDRELGEGN